MLTIAAMNNPKVIMAILAGALTWAVQVAAQPVLYQVNIKGTCLTTNGNGDIVTEKLSNQSLIQDAVTGTSGLTNSSGLTVVYAQNASSDPSVSGDFIEVVNSTNGAVVYTNLQFMYGGSFPPALTNAAGTEIVAGAQVLPLPLAGEGDTLGGATITERFLKNKTLISGSFNYTTLRSPASTSNDVVSACSGTFTVNKTFTPK